MMWPLFWARIDGSTAAIPTKFAARAISEVLRIEAGPDIRTAILSPGAIESELKQGSSDPDAAKVVGTSIAPTKFQPIPFSGAAHLPSDVSWVFSAPRPPRSAAESS